MAQVDVSNEVTVVSAGNTLIQNLGPDVLYVGGTAVTEDDGLKVLNGQWVKLLGVSKVGLISDGNADVRLQVAAEAIGGTVVPPLGV